jgi:hypothetical protein
MSINATSITRVKIIPAAIEENIFSLSVVDTELNVTNFRLGMNWIDQQLHGDATSVANGATVMAASTEIVCTHTMWFGPYNPWRTHLETEAQMHWANEAGEPDNLDYRLDLLTDKNLSIAVTIGLTPTWMVTDDNSHDGENLNVTYQETAPTVNHFDEMAELTRRFLVHMRTRFGVNKVERVQLWNELKGFWSIALNRWRYEDLVTLYNGINTVVQAFNATLDAGELHVLIGGPYVSLSTGGPNPTPGADNELYLANGDHVDTRTLDALLYFRDNAAYYDFICLDGANRYVNDIMEWYDIQFPNIPIIWNEFYSGYFNTTTPVNQKRAALITNIARCIKTGVVSAYLWEPESRIGDAGEFADQWTWVDTGNAGGGTATDTATILQKIKTDFPSGTQLYDYTLDPNDADVEIVMSATNALIVNNKSIDIVVEGTTIPAYSADVIDIVASFAIEKSAIDSDTIAATDAAGNIVADATTTDSDSVSITETSSVSEESAAYTRTWTTKVTSIITDTSITVDKPVGTINGDRLIMFVATGYNSTNVVARPADWTEINIVATATNGANCKLQAWTKIASNEPANWTFDVSAVNAQVMLAVVAIPSAPSINAVGNTQNGNVTVHTTGSITTNVDGAHIWHCYAIAASADETVDPATSEIFESDKSAAYPIQIVIAEEIQASMGATTGRTITTAAAAWAALKTIALA